ncbi:aquaporin-like protein [Zopfia rhizophila CBS 207.26]|uniref:Aquaporin-like protein n=1 Tax=Zopfia rhizophila CBS 207.26 TaxID=1314779 RepID=A0A6A6DHS3_9PEZI|nr:aquaporin-like protein [Zopfia rhizophila CBS 207.26]
MAVSTNEDIELAESHINHELRHRKNSHAPSVASRPFVGRIGGNQEFTISPGDYSFQTVVSKAPDAAAKFSWKQSFGLRSFADVELWKEATIEGVGTCLQIYLAGLYAIGLGPTGTETAIGPITPAAFGAIANFLLISFFIYAGGPVSGGHFNPLITMSTFFARLSTFPRSLLYILFQCTGSVIAGFMVRASLGTRPSTFREVPGCYIDTSLVKPGEAYAIPSLVLFSLTGARYALETMSSFALIFIAFGVGLDPRQRQVFGPSLSPILVGLAIGLCSFASGIARPGYAGASMNPARCLGLMAAAERFNYHYIHWFGDLTAAMLNGIMYWAIPIYKD